MEVHRYDTLRSFELRPQFHRQLYRGLLKVVFINSLILSGLCILTVYLGFYGFKPEHYFTTSLSGKIIELHARAASTYPRKPLESPPANGQPAPSPVPKTN